MNAEILCFGSEILHGDIVNSNAQYISKKMAEIGINVYYHSVVGDNHTRMEEAFRLAFERVDIVICTGGLGPTQDDITKEILAKYHQLKMVYDEDSHTHVKQIYQRLKKDMPESNIRQAYFPEGSIILHNSFGTANGCLLEKNSKIAVLLPGPPKEVMPMFEELVIPYLMRYSEGVIVGRKYVVTGLGESTTESMIMDLVEKQTNPTIATFAGNGRVLVRVTAKAMSKSEAEGLIIPIENELLQRLAGYIYQSETVDVGEHSAKMLLKHKLTIAVAESCTGGLVSAKLISYPGISESFRQGFVAYSNRSKIESLDVKEDTLLKYGAVSPQTAEEMATGAALRSNADVGLSTTGIAGPTGGTEDKPVGLVYIAVYYKGRTTVKKINYPGSRDVIMERAALAVLDLLNKTIAKEHLGSL
ncbi:MAG: Putative competence-damage inducible protein [Clostridiales bacterium 38_11]|nr:MAG: Putative competence-damage inducible protein [Clostridiales bacterium 38_11]HBH13561.1 competence/damage-inducible protein A [Clostridiales bacterium]